MNEAKLIIADLSFNYLYPIISWFSHQPELAIFISIGIGFFIGTKKIASFQLGGVCGTLIVALFLGQSGIIIPPEIKNIFFALFIFALGYSGGPQFFSSFNAKGLRLGLFSLIEASFVLLIAFIAMKLFSLDPGTTAGLIAGAATESAVIGTASDAISRLSLPYEQIQALQANIVTAYSVTYIFGLLTIVLFTSQIIPLILRKNVQKEADKLWESLGGSTLSLSTNASDTPVEMIGRSFIISTGKGKTVSRINALLGRNTFIESIYRNKKKIPISDSLILHSDDAVLVFGPRNTVMLAGSVLGKECATPSELNMVMDIEKYAVSKKQSAGMTLYELIKKIRKAELNRHVHLISVTRNGHDMPLIPQLILKNHDLIQLIGDDEMVKKAGKMIGKKLPDNQKANFIYIGAGIILGILIGQISLPFKGIDLSLGTGGGALLTGLIFGWMQTKSPRIPSTSSAALELMKDIGLASFVACIGLSAGKQAFILLKQYGPILPLIGICISLIPAFLSFLIGHFVFKIQLPILLGGIAGQQCSTPALSAVQAEAGNTTPLIGYTITYAISNVLLPLLGPIIIGIGLTKNMS